MIDRVEIVAKEKLVDAVEMLDTAEMQQKWQRGTIEILKTVDGRDSGDGEEQ